MLPSTNSTSSLRSLVINFKFFKFIIIIIYPWCACTAALFDEHTLTVCTKLRLGQALPYICMNLQCCPVHNASAFLQRRRFALQCFSFKDKVVYACLQFHIQAVYMLITGLCSGYHTLVTRLLEPCHKVLRALLQPAKHGCGCLVPTVYFCMGN